MNQPNSTTNKTKPKKKVKIAPGSAFKAVSDRKKLQAAYNDRKAKVMEREKTNDRLVILFHDDGDWWKIVGRSVLYYTRIIAPRIRGKDVQVWPDDDYTAPSAEGEIRIPNLEKCFAEVEKIGYKTEKASEDYAYIQLHNKVTEEDLNRLRKEDENVWMMSEKIIQPMVVWPTLKAEAIILLRSLWEQTRKMGAPQRIMVGDKLVEQMVGVILAINDAAHDFCSPEEALVAMQGYMNKVEGYMLIVMNLRLFNSKRIYETTTQVMKVRKIIERELKAVRKAIKEEPEDAKNKA